MLSFFEEERDVGGVPHLPQRDSRGFTIFRSNGLSVRHDHPTLGLGDAAYQRQHQAHRMNVEQYQELQRQLHLTAAEEDKQPPPRGVMSLGLPDNLRPGTLPCWAYRAWGGCHTPHLPTPWN